MKITIEGNNLDYKEIMKALEAIKDKQDLESNDDNKFIFI